MPSMISIVVVLPAPFGPSRPKQMPSGTLKDTPATAVVAGYSFTRSRTSRIVGITGCHGALQTLERDPSGFAPWPPRPLGGGGCCAVCDVYHHRHEHYRSVRQVRAGRAGRRGRALGPR